MTEVSSPLLVGPLLRYVDESAAAIWVEVADRGIVTVMTADREYAAHTFTVHGHHYALVDLTDLEPGRTYPYTVAVNGTRVWPLPGSSYPAGRARAVTTDERLRVAFGSCRTVARHDAVRSGGAVPSPTDPNVRFALGSLLQASGKPDIADRKRCLEEGGGNERDETGRRRVCAYASMGITVTEMLRQTGLAVRGRVGLVPYLLAPGRFATEVRRDAPSGTARVPPRCSERIQPSSSSGAAATSRPQPTRFCADLRR